MFRLAYQQLGWQNRSPLHSLHSQRVVPESHQLLVHLLLQLRLPRKLSRCCNATTDSSLSPRKSRLLHDATML